MSVTLIKIDFKFEKINEFTAFLIGTDICEISQMEFVFPAFFLQKRI